MNYAIINIDYLAKMWYCYYISIVMSKTQGFKRKYIAYGIKSKHKSTAKQALNKMFKTYLKILSF